MDFTNQHQHAAVSHTPRHSHVASPSGESFTYPHHSTPTVIYTSCSAEHSCVRTEHPATAVGGPGWYTTTLERSGREVELKRPATAVTALTRSTTVSEDINTEGMLVPVHRVAESPGVGILAGSALHSTSSASGAVGPIETASMLLPVHRVAESPGVVGVETSMSAGREG